jgi:hypothetical protein
MAGENKGGGLDNSPPPSLLAYNCHSEEYTLRYKAIKVIYAGGNDMTGEQSGLRKWSKLLKKSAVLAICGLAILMLPLGGCSNNDLQSQVQTLTAEKTALQSTVQKLTQENAAQQNALKVDKVATASSVTTTNGQLDWRNYTAQKTFTAGYTGGLWVMFNFSNMLHDKTINVKVDMYLISNGETKAVKNKVSSMTDATDNSLWWGDTFDISGLPAGDYAALVTVTDVIAGTAAAQMTAFNITK